MLFTGTHAALMSLFAFGINHQTAPLAVREQVVFQTEQLIQALRDLVAERPVTEAAIISTCNRTEIYCATAQPEGVVDWLANYHRLSAAQIKPYLVEWPEDQAVAHAFRVASGLDSMVLGEPQILGQFKTAVRSAEEAGTLGWLLNKLFQRTFSVAKRVRTETEIGANTVSMAAAAVRLAERIYPTITEEKILFIGAGEMIELAATHFAARQPRQLTFANRTIARAQGLAERFVGETIPLEAVSELLAGFDIVVSCTASPLPIIGKGLMESAIKTRRRRPILVFDLAVPRDVEIEVSALEDVFLYTVDDLGEIARQGLEQRAEAVSQAEVIITEQVGVFQDWLGQRELVPMIRALRATAEQARSQELARAERRLAQGGAPQEVLAELARALTNKLIHPPTHALSHASEQERAALVAALSRLYSISGTDTNIE